MAEIAAGRPVMSAAAAASMSERTARRRLHDPGIAAMLDRQRSEILRRAVDQLMELVNPAVRTVATLLESDQDSVRLRAAGTVLTQALRWHEVGDLDQRLATLEAALDAVSTRQ